MRCCPSAPVAPVLVAARSAGCGGGPAGRPRTEGHLQRPGRQGVLPRPPVDRATRPAWSCRCATPARKRCRTSRSRSTPSPTPRTIPNWPRTSARSGSIENGPGAIPQRPVAERGGQPARRRPDGLRQHLGARPARARAHRHVHLARRAGEGRQLHRPLHGRRRARRQSARAAGRRRPRGRALHGRDRPATAGHPRRPRNRPGRAGRLPGPRRASACRADGGVGPLSKASFPSLSPGGDVLRPPSHYDSPRPSRPHRTQPPWLCARPPTLALPEEESIPPMPRTRQQNVTAAQWSANGSALGSPDLTLQDNQVFGANVFSPAVQRHRLPKHVYKALQRTLARGEALDTTLADSVAQAMKEWAMEKGATHYTHWFQPLTGSTAEKHDSFYGPARRGHRDRRVLRQGADPGRARRLLVPDRRHPRDVRGPRLHGLGPDLARRSSSRTPTARCSASRPRSRPGPARRSTTRSRCCARWTRSPARRSARSSCSASTTPSGCSRRSAASRSTS